MSYIFFHSDSTENLIKDRLFSSTKEFYSKRDKEDIRNLFLENYDKINRKELWLIASGARREKVKNPDYYNDIVNNYPPYIFSLHETTIKNDIGRTFQDEKFFQQEETQNKLNNILLAYSRRNNTIGYCQGFNLIVGRILEVIENEEDTFWILTTLIEDILPISYYNELSGVMVDTEILMDKIEITLHELYDDMKTKNTIICLKTLIFKWLTTIFTENMNKEIYLPILDGVFLYGDLFIMKAALLILSLAQKKILQFEGIEDASVFFEEGIKNFKHEKFRKKLFQKDSFKLLTELKIKMQEMRATKAERINKDIKSTQENSKDKKKTFTEKNCNLDWPYCKKSFGKIEIIEVMKFKLLEKPIIENDFYDFNKQRNVEKLIQSAAEQNKKIRESYNDTLQKQTYCFGNLLIDRANHTCKSTMSSRNNILGKFLRKSSLMGHFFDSKKKENEEKNSKETEFEDNKDLMEAMSGKKQTSIKYMTTFLENLNESGSLSDTEISVLKEQWISDDKNMSNKDLPKDIGDTENRIISSETPQDIKEEQNINDADKEPQKGEIKTIFKRNSTNNSEIKAEGNDKGE